MLATRILLTITASLTTFAQLRSNAAEAPPASSEKASALLGSADFQPTPEHPYGWRGDGSGLFPGATPPLHWGRWLDAPLSDAVCQVGKPSATPTPRPEDRFTGIVKDWLVLGPFPCETPAAGLDATILNDEANAQPEEGQKSGEHAWQNFRISPKTRSWWFLGRWGVDFQSAFKQAAHHMAYAASNIYVPADQKAMLSTFFPDAARIWINGKQILNEAGPHQMNYRPNIPVELKQGWNRILLKSAVGNASAPGNYAWTWTCQVALSPVGATRGLTKNCKWLTPMPASTFSQPIISGDRIFTQAEQCDLICLDKHSGKVLWMRSQSNFTTACEELQRTKPEFYSEKLAPLAAKHAELTDKLVAAMNAGVSKDAPVPIDHALIKQRTDIEAQGIAAARELLDKATYADLKDTWEQSQPGWSVATPVCDGKFIYVWFENAVAACYDLDGKRQWIRKLPYLAGAHHGWVPSPVLSEGKFITYLSKLKAFDAKTGNVAWEAAGAFTWGSPLLINIGGKNAVLCNEGSAFSVQDGRQLWGRLVGPANVTPSLVMGGRNVYIFNQDNYAKPTLNIVPLPDHEAAPKAHSVPMSWDIASPVCQDGIFYTVNEYGDFVAFDTATEKILYTEYVDLQPINQAHGVPGISASLTIAGKYLYVMDNCGTTVVLQPGREYKQLARNAFNTGDITQSTPVFEGKYMYYRSAANLYCIGEE